MKTKIIKALQGSILLLGFCGFYTPPASAKTGVADQTIYQFKVQDINNRSVDMSSYRGKALLIVNTASYCGYTSQYKSLQKTYDQFKNQGLVVLGFPSNDFGRQEPGSNKEIKDFCELNYKVSFPLFSKVVVSGNQKSPLFKYLTEESGAEFKRPIDWNFEKFLIARDGRLIARFKSSADPQSSEVLTAISASLKASSGQPSSNKALPKLRPDK